MKIKLLCTLFIVVCAAQLLAQEHPVMQNKEITKEKFERARKRFYNGLRSDNDGVVEAVLMLITKTKISIPELDVRDMQMIIDSISSNYSSVTVKYEAYLSSIVIANPEWFARNDFSSERNPERYFTEVTEHLQVKLFGLNSF
jgi:hypothetical protein